MMNHARQARPVERIAWIAALVTLFVYLSPFFLQGQQAGVRIHDILDMTRAPLRADPGLLFVRSDHPIPEIMNGVPRRAFGAEWNVSALTATLLPRFEGYVLNQVLLRLFALVSMYLLLGALIRRTDDPDGLIRVGMATCFALLPFYGRFGGSLPTVALQSWALLAIWREESGRRHWVALVLSPLYSYIYIGPLYVLAAVGIAFLVHAVRTRRPRFRVLAALLVSGGIYLLCEYRLVLYAFAGTGIESHRVEFQDFSRNFATAEATAMLFLREGQYDHGWTLALPVLWTVIAAALALGAGATVRALGARRALRPLLGLGLALAVAIAAKAATLHRIAWAAIAVCAGVGLADGKRLGRRAPAGRLAVVVLLIGGVSILAAFYRWTDVQDVVRSMPTLRLMQWDRIYLVLPVLVYVASGLALVVLVRTLGLPRLVIVGVVALQIGVLAAHSDFRKRAHLGSYRAFFAAEQMDAIKSHIGADPSTYRVVSIGMYPSIAAENGMYCLDAYVPDYALTYKHQFRRVIRHELAKNEGLTSYFDKWGSRCYVWVDELDRRDRSRRVEITKDIARELTSLDLDLDALYDMGGRYLLSAVPLGPDAREGLRFHRTFEHDGSMWTVHLYEVIAPDDR